MLTQFFTIVLLACLIGCGLKTRPRSPELDFRPDIPAKKTETPSTAPKP